MTKRILTFIVVFAYCVVLGGQSLLSAFSVKASAAETAESYDKTSIGDDLSGIDRSNYRYNALGEPEIISVMEYCFSYHEEYESFYNLYFYVYNPTCQPIDVLPDNNSVNIYAGADENSRASAKLVRLDYTSDFMFYKFKLLEPASILERAKAEMTENGTRTYDVTEIQLRYENDLSAVSHDETTKYVFTGYAAYCDENKSEIGTLECKSLGSEGIHLAVHNTYYRADTPSTPFWSETASTSTVDQLDSVYFSIPEEYYENFGDLTQIKAEWYEYKTAPIFVTDYADAYIELMDYLNVSVEPDGTLTKDSSAKLNYSILWEVDAIAVGNVQVYKTFAAEKGRIGSSSFYVNDLAFNCNFLRWLFYRDANKTLTDEDWNVSTDELMEYMKMYSKEVDDNLLLGKYPRSLFCQSAGLYDFKLNVIDAKRRKLLDSEDQETGAGHVELTFGEGKDVDFSELSFLDTVKDQDWWSEFWFGSDTVTEPIEPIKTVKEAHLVLSDEEISEMYKVHITDVPKFKEFCKQSFDKNERPVLMRFAVTDYYTSKARFDYDGDDGSVSNINGYVAQETVFLNFDVISLSFTDPDGKYVKTFGVVANPIDIINAIEAPDGMENKWLNWLTAIAGLIVLVIILVVVMPFISPLLHAVWDVVWTGIKLIVKFIFGILTFPFRLVARLFSR